MEGRGEDGQGFLLGDEIGMGLGCSDVLLEGGRDRGVATSSISAGPSVPRKLWKKACKRACCDL